MNGGTIVAIADDYQKYRATSTYIFGASGSNSGACAGIEFNGGNIYIENKGSGKAIAHWSGVPESGFRSNDKIYSLGVVSTSDADDRAKSQFVIHSGTRSNQMDLFYIDSMRPKALDLESLDVTTREKAENAIEKIEKALEKALDTATDLGSYMSRLEHTESNLEVKAENTALSDSVLRDADMAKEMTEYTRYNILTQSSQAMLAQAGQNQSQVLSLLQ